MLSKITTIAVVLAAVSCSTNAAIEVNSVGDNANANKILAAPPARLGAKDWSGFCYSLRTEKIGICNAEINFCKHVNSDTWQNPHPLYTAEACGIPLVRNCSHSTAYSSPSEPSEQIKKILIAGAIQSFTEANPNCTAPAN